MEEGNYAVMFGVRMVQPVGFFGTEFEFHLRGFEEGCDHFENICVAQRGIVKSGCINQDDTTTV